MLFYSLQFLSSKKFTDLCCCKECSCLSLRKHFYCIFKIIQVTKLEKHGSHIKCLHCNQCRLQLPVQHAHKIFQQGSTFKYSKVIRQYNDTGIPPPHSHNDPIALPTSFVHLLKNKNWGLLATVGRALGWAGANSTTHSISFKFLKNWHNWVLAQSTLVLGSYCLEYHISLFMSVPLCTLDIFGGRSPALVCKHQLIH